MTSREIVIQNKIGLHARPASLLIQQAKQYKSNVMLEKGGVMADLNSIVSLLKMRVKYGDIVILHADGPDEDSALRDLVKLIDSKFGEE